MNTAEKFYSKLHLGQHDCARDGGICEDTPDSYTCRCRSDYLDVSPEPQTRPGRACKKLTNECTQGLHDCSSNADCIDTPDSYVCRCLAGFVDVSLDAVNRPGRRCLELVNECAENRHDCSPNADVSCNHCGIKIKASTHTVRIFSASIQRTLSVASACRISLTSHLICSICLEGSVDQREWTNAIWELTIVLPLLNASTEPTDLLAG